MRKIFIMVSMVLGLVGSVFAEDITDLFTETYSYETEEGKWSLEYMSNAFKINKDGYILTEAIALVSPDNNVYIIEVTPKALLNRELKAWRKQFETARTFSISPDKANPIKDEIESIAYEKLGDTTHIAVEILELMSKK